MERVIELPEGPELANVWTALEGIYPRSGLSGSLIGPFARAPSPPPHPPTKKPFCDFLMSDFFSAKSYPFNFRDVNYIDVSFSVKIQTTYRQVVGHQPLTP